MAVFGPASFQGEGHVHSLAVPVSTVGVTQEVTKRLEAVSVTGPRHGSSSEDRRGRASGSNSGEGTIGLRKKNERCALLDDDLLGEKHGLEALLPVDVAEAVPAADVENGVGGTDPTDTGIA